MVRDDKGKGKLNDDKGNRKGKETTEEEDPKPLDVPMHTKEEEPNLLDVPMQTEEEDPIPLDIVYPHPETTSSSRGTNTRGQAYYGLKSLGPIQEEQNFDVLVLAERETLKFLAQDKSLVGL
ncbi:hypothetical protein Tco_1252934 [Tanacetum coccineum]